MGWVISAVDIAIKILEKDEGFREKPYYDTKHIPTYGHGFVCGKKDDPLPDIKITLKQSLSQLKVLVLTYERALLSNQVLYPAYVAGGLIRKAVVLSMVHQLGIKGLLGFKKMISALSNKDYEEASRQCLDSQAAKVDAPSRFKRNAEMLKTGVIHPYYN